MKHSILRSLLAALAFSMLANGITPAVAPPNPNVSYKSSTNEIGVEEHASSTNEIGVEGLRLSMQEV